MVAAPSQRLPRQAPTKGRRSLELIQGSLSANKVARQAPWLANLHRVADGALAGLGLSMVGLAALSLHWQTQWTQSFQRLESAQVLEHRLQESAAVLEQHHLGAAHRPGLLVPTSSEKLVYLNSPEPPLPRPMSSLLAGITTRQVLPGY
ncbi:hypothetical protein [Cyanobium sp. Morenito 9A2]|uniref:hypothetical protein n=1 Tax=Cyanobium sp. Morenito 9A2 TaxID=2823718 RepID=UPI0020CD5020|nr:hypothetical protein [Cyanobium sp. Morenito 9A2]